MTRRSDVQSSQLRPARDRIEHVWPGNLHVRTRHYQLAGDRLGFVVLFGMIAGKRLDGWTAFFLATTVATSVTGFGFPIHGWTPGLAIGIVSLVVLAVAIYAWYARSSRASGVVCMSSRR